MLIFSVPQVSFGRLLSCPMSLVSFAIHSSTFPTSSSSSEISIRFSVPVQLKSSQMTVTQVFRLISWSRHMTHLSFNLTKLPVRQFLLTPLVHCVLVCCLLRLVSHLNLLSPSASSFNNLSSISKALVSQFEIRH